MLPTKGVTVETRDLQPASSVVYENLLFRDRPAIVGTRMSFARDEDIYVEADEARLVYKVVKGVVRTLKVLSDGRRHVGEFHLPGDIFGFESGSTHRATAEAVTDTIVLAFRRTSLEGVAAQDAALAHRLWQLAASNLDRMLEHVLLVSRRTAPERVAAFLLDMDSRMQPAGPMSLPMTRRDIADYLGLTHETVSRIMSQFHAEGVVERSAARRIKVQRRSSLEALSSDHA